jgi:hypothetical protein
MGPSGLELAVKEQSAHDRLVVALGQVLQEQRCSQGASFDASFTR